MLNRKLTAEGGDTPQKGNIGLITNYFLYYVIDTSVRCACEVQCSPAHFTLVYMLNFLGVGLNIDFSLSQNMKLGKLVFIITWFLLLSLCFTAVYCSAQHGQQKKREHAPAAANGTVIQWYRTAQGTKDRLTIQPSAQFGPDFSSDTVIYINRCINFVDSTLE